MGPQRPEGTNGEEQNPFRKKQWDNAGTDNLAREEKNTALEAASTCKLMPFCDAT
jgi:hypothetical protein